MKPHPALSHDIDALFKEYIDRRGWVHMLRKKIRNPLGILKQSQAIREQFLLLSTYHSNAIEGSRMTERETEQALNGEKVKGKELFEELEAINHRNALLHLLETVTPGFQITESYILTLHQIVMYNFYNKLPGKYRTSYVNLVNTEKRLPTAQEAPLKCGHSSSTSTAPKGTWCKK